jgi:hypothetical protein
MKISPPSLRTILAGSLLVLPPTTALVLVQGDCPAIIAALLPKDASNRSGQYFPGESSTGKGSADLSYANPTCAKSKFRSRITLEVKHYGGETAILIKSEESPFGPIDRDTVQARFMTDATNELVQTRHTPRRETLGAGEIVYVEYQSECPPEGPAQYAARVGPMIVPNVKLRGTAWAGNAHVEVELEGSISVELAKAAVADVFANLQKADFAGAQ